MVSPAIWQAKGLTYMVSPASWQAKGLTYLSFYLTLCRPQQHVSVLLEFNKVTT
jgi:hypothetical protein